MFGLIVALSGCALPLLAGLDADDAGGAGGADVADDETSLEPLMLSVTSERFTLAWNPSDSPADQYRLYYRLRGGSDWEPLSTIDAAADPEEGPTFEVSEDVLDAGHVYEFAVSSVYNGEESQLHTSLSEDAEPDRGWYVSWEPS